MIIELFECHNIIEKGGDYIFILWKCQIIIVSKLYYYIDAAAWRTT